MIDDVLLEHIGKIVASEVAAFPDLSKPFHLTTDASNYAVEAVPSQNYDGKYHPIAYFSRSLNKTELHSKRERNASDSMGLDN